MYLYPKGNYPWLAGATGERVKQVSAVHIQMQRMKYLNPTPFEVGFLI